MQIKKPLVTKRCNVHEDDTLHYSIDDVLLKYKCVACEKEEELKGHEQAVDFMNTNYPEEEWS